MKDPHVREDLSAYLDDMLNSDEKTRVEAHLESCADCRTVFNELKNMVTWMKSVPNPLPRTGLEARLIARLKEGAAKKSRPFFWIPLSGGLATAMVALIVFVMIRENHLDKQSLQLLDQEKASKRLVAVDLLEKAPQPLEEDKESHPSNIPLKNRHSGESRNPVFKLDSKKMVEDLDSGLRQNGETKKLDKPLESKSNIGFGHGVGSSGGSASFAEKESNESLTLRESAPKPVMVAPRQRDELKRGVGEKIQNAEKGSSIDAFAKTKVAKKESSLEPVIPAKAGIPPSPNTGYGGQASLNDSLLVGRSFSEGRDSGVRRNDGDVEHAQSRKQSQLDQKGFTCKITQPEQHIIRTKEEWTKLIKRMGFENPDSVLSSVDFSTQMIAAVFLGEKPSAGYTIQIVSEEFRETPSGRTLVLTFQKTSPSKNAMTASVMTQPYHLKVLPLFPGPVQFQQAERSMKKGMEN